MSRFHRASAVLLLLAAACATYRPAEGPLKDFEFLKGTWVRITSSETTEEIWTYGKGWSLRGTGRVYDAGRQVSGEELAIEPRGGSFAYVARLPGAAPVEFALVERGPTWARFENPAHDFPQRIEYRRDGNRLRAEISGVEHGVARTEVLEFRRVP